MQTIVVDLGTRRPTYIKGGQYVQLKVGDSKPAFIALASPPTQAGTSVELLIKSQGGTSELLTALQSGDHVDASPAMGKGFDVSSIPVSDVDTILLFATGSGISPIRALIESGALAGKQRRGGVKLFFGCKSMQHMAFTDRFAAWEAEMGVRVIPVLSSGGSGWTGHTGYVQDALLALDKDGDKAAALAKGARTAVVIE